MTLVLIRRMAVASLALAGLWAAGLAFASEELSKKSNYIACHAIDIKRLGPSTKEVSAKYEGDSSAAEMLVKKIRAGGGGVWGEMAMPAQA